MNRFNKVGEGREVQKQTQRTVKQHDIRETSNLEPVETQGQDER